MTRTGEHEGARKLDPALLIGEFLLFGVWAWLMWLLFVPGHGTMLFLYVPVFSGAVLCVSIDKSRVALVAAVPSRCMGWRHGCGRPL